MAPRLPSWWPGQSPPFFFHMITQHRIQDSAKADRAHELFGSRFLWVESFVLDTAASLSADYDGGSWAFYSLSNAGFYLAPETNRSFRVSCENGFEGTLSSEGFGITSCLYAYSLLSFSPDAEFAERCATQYELLRAFALAHDEAKEIFAAVD
jgi:hypothetical protein